MTSRFPPFAFVELVSPYNKKNITRWLEDMNFMFSWQEHKIHIFSTPCNILYLYVLTVTIPPENEGDEREEEEDAIPGQRNYTVQHLYNSNSTKCLYIFQI